MRDCIFNPYFLLTDEGKDCHTKGKNTNKCRAHGQGDEGANSVQKEEQQRAPTS